MNAAPELWTLLRVLLSLVVVLSLAVVVLRFGLPWLQRLQGGAGRRGPLELVQVLTVDRLHRLAVVRWGERELLVGVGGGVRLLASQGAANTDRSQSNEGDGQRAGELGRDAHPGADAGFAAPTADGTAGALR